MHLRSLGGMLSASTLFLYACSSSPEADPGTPNDPPPPAPDDASAPPQQPAITWAPCTLPGYYDDVTADCATVEMPARRDVPDSGTTPVAVYRLKSKKQPPTAQLWMLQGGPGVAGYTLAPYAKQLTTLPTGIDVYMVDHRGTGESTFLECPRSMTNSRNRADFGDKCSTEIREAYGPRVDGFSTTESAHDTKDMIALAAVEGQKVFVYGGSYGSYWAHRLLQLPDFHPDAVVTDGNCISDVCTANLPQSLTVEEPMKYVLDACKEVPECSAHLGADPWAFAVATFAKIAEGHCKSAKIAKASPADILFSVGASWPEALPPLLYRLDRCSAEDVTVLDKLDAMLGVTFGSLVHAPLFDTPHPTMEKAMSFVLSTHVVASEMISKPAPSRATLEAKAAEATFKPDPRVFDLSYYDAWHGYPRDALVGGWIDRDVPWLMMQGTFDFQTPVSRSLAAVPKIHDPSLQYVRVEGGGHGVAFDSACSLSILEAFFANPRAKVDTSCLADVKATMLKLEERYIEYYFGTKDAWD